MEKEIITGDRYLKIMWPMNDMFRARLLSIRAIPYDSTFESEADDAIRNLANNPSEAWSNISDGAWRVLLERHTQMLAVAMANMIADKPLMTLPPGPGLTDDDLRVGLSLFWLLEMKLPFPVRDLSRYEFPPSIPGKPN
jgi:hypothetical protein